MGWCTECTAGPVPIIDVLYPRALYIQGCVRNLAAAVWVTILECCRYYSLRRPSWVPPGPVFGLVWSVLYTITGYASYQVSLIPPSVSEPEKTSGCSRGDTGIHCR